MDDLSEGLVDGVLERKTVSVRNDENLVKT